MYSAIDMVMDKLEKQVRKHKEKVKDHKPPGAETVKEALGAQAGRPSRRERPRIVTKENRFIKPMSVEEAAMQMGVVDNDFLVFTDSATSHINVIYRTKDGEYGLIERR